jgi:hypothetical protein
MDVFDAGLFATFRMTQYFADRSTMCVIASLLCLWVQLFGLRAQMGPFLIALFRTGICWYAAAIVGGEIHGSILSGYFSLVFPLLSILSLATNSSFGVLCVTEVLWLCMFALEWLRLCLPPRQRDSGLRQLMPSCRLGQKVMQELCKKGFTRKIALQHFVEHALDIEAGFNERKRQCDALGTKIRALSKHLWSDRVSSALL